MRAANIDRNQPEIVEALRKSGCTVQHLHKVGQGCPDILVGTGKRNILMEIKDGTKPPSARKLTSDQVVWHSEWKGQVAIVSCIEDALKLINY